MKQTLLIISFLLFPSLEILACSCSWAWNDSFSRTARNSEFIALIKVLSFDEYLERDIWDSDERIPYSMTVEVIKKYKGRESREKVKILGDNGVLCRPYLSEFEVGSYYLAAPIPINDISNTEYEFFFCRTDYLKVNRELNIAYGEYSLIRYQIGLEAFERKLKNRKWDFVFFGFLVVLLITILTIRKTKKSEE